jgi:hypothetical protein
MVIAIDRNAEANSPRIGTKSVARVNHPIRIITFTKVFRGYCWSDIWNITGDCIIFFTNGLYYDKSKIIKEIIYSGNILFDLLNLCLVNLIKNKVRFPTFFKSLD